MYFLCYILIYIYCYCVKVFFFSFGVLIIIIPIVVNEYLMQVVKFADTETRV